MVEHEERLAVSSDPSHVLAQRTVVELDAREDDEPIVAGGEPEPVVLVHPVVVVGDGKKVVPEVSIARDDFVDGMPPVGEGRMGVEITLEAGHRRGGTTPR